MTTYETVQGDMFDGIAQELLGNVNYMPAIMKLNPAHRMTQRFAAGVTLTIPDVEDAESDTPLPPWKRSAG